MLLSRGLYEVALLMIVLVQVPAQLLNQEKTPVKNQEFLQAFEARLLDIFGLPARPRPKRSIKIPDYMLELYKQQAAPRNRLQLRAPHWASTIRSHVHQEFGDEDQYGPNRVRLRFNVSLPAKGEVLKEAELRLFTHPLRSCPVSSKGAECWRRQRVQVYDIIRPATKRQDAILRLIDTKTMRVRNATWQTFDVFPAVSRWQQRPSSNYGLYVQVTDMDGSVNSREHVRLKRSTNESVEDDAWLREQPVLVTFSDDAHSARSTGSQRARRTTTKKYRQKNRKDNACRRHSMYVDFNDVGWTDWIVAPPGYQAYFCHGLCEFPLADHLNSTNHAIVQTLVNSVSRTAVPRACCVPTELSPISLLYLDGYDKVVLKNYQDMVVEGCGCR